MGRGTRNLETVQSRMSLKIRSDVAELVDSHESSENKKRRTFNELHHANMQVSDSREAVLSPGRDCAVKVR